MNHCSVSCRMAHCLLHYLLALVEHCDIDVIVDLEAWPTSTFYDSSLIADSSSTICYCDYCGISKEQKRAGGSSFCTFMLYSLNSVHISRDVNFFALISDGSSPVVVDHCYHPMFSKLCIRLAYLLGAFLFQNSWVSLINSSALKKMLDIASTKEAAVV